MSLFKLYHKKNDASFMPVNLVFEIYTDKRSMGNGLPVVSCRLPVCDDF